MTWRDAAAPLSNRTFAWYLASRAADTLGTTMAGVALVVSGVASTAVALLTLASRSVRTLGRTPPGTGSEDHAVAGQR